MKCRICGSNNVNNVGVHKPYLDYEFDVYECEQCNSYFVNRDGAIYEALHESDSSTYTSHQDLAREAYQLFKNKDVKALRNKLSEVAKNKFVINTIENISNINDMLEIGCSRGYLTSYFIATGKKVLGVDSSKTVIGNAASLFGDHFCLTGDKRIKEGKPYDAIYYVGTIGCVDTPLEMTIDFFDMLRPGGALVFNAPNVLSAKGKGLVWFDGTNPPDLVTLFHENIWRTTFKDKADIHVEYEKEAEYQSLFYLIKRLFKKPILKPATSKLFQINENKDEKFRALKYKEKRIINQIKKILNYFPWSLLLPKHTAEKTMYVVIRKKY